jgi:hypothetical protein
MSAEARPQSLLSAGGAVPSRKSAGPCAGSRRAGFVGVLHAVPCHVAGWSWRLWCGCSGVEYERLVIVYLGPNWTIEQNPAHNSPSRTGPRWHAAADLLNKGAG